MSHADSTAAERRIDNIEFNVADIARSKQFYGQVFGWSFTDYGPAYTEFDDGRLEAPSVDHLRPHRHHLPAPHHQNTVREQPRRGLTHRRLLLHSLLSAIYSS